MVQFVMANFMAKYNYLVNKADVDPTILRSSIFEWETITGENWAGIA
jgi:hypothetical protein